MTNKVDNSAKAAENYGSGKNSTTISGELALQMWQEGKIKPESLQISDKGIATFQDQSGGFFRAELTPEQVAAFQVKTPVSTEVTSPVIKESSAVTNFQAGSAKAFTGIFDDHQDKNIQPEIKTEPPKKDNPDNQWTFNARFGFNRTKYFDTDMHLKSSRLDVNIKDFSFQERTSAGFYNPANWEQPMDAGRWIDEPTNSFTLSAAKNKNVFSLTVFHPKFLKEPYEDKHVTGTVDGVYVDKVMPINEPFDGYNDQPGQMHLTRFENTYRQMDLQAGYGRDITIADMHKFGKFVYTPSVYAGVSAGYHLDVYNKPGEYWEYNDHQDPLKIQGANVAVGNKIQYELGRANIFVENKFTFSHFKHQFQDGTAEYNMKYNATTFGLGYQLYKTKAKTPTTPAE
jgi:hypothetical protein